MAVPSNFGRSSKSSTTIENVFMLTASVRKLVTRFLPAEFRVMSRIVHDETGA